MRLEINYKRKPKTNKTQQKHKLLEAKQYANKHKSEIRNQRKVKYIYIYILRDKKLLLETKNYYYANKHKSEIRGK